MTQKKEMLLFLVVLLFFSGCVEHIVPESLLSCETAKSCIERAILVSHQGIHSTLDTDALLYKAIDLIELRNVQKG